MNIDGTFFLHFEIDTQQIPFKICTDQMEFRFVQNHLGNYNYKPNLF